MEKSRKFIVTDKHLVADNVTTRSNKITEKKFFIPAWLYGNMEERIDPGMV